MKSIGIYVPKPEYLSGWFDSGIIQRLTKSNKVYLYGPEYVIQELTKTHKPNSLINFNFITIYLSKPSLFTESYKFISKVTSRFNNPTLKFQIYLQAFGEVNWIPKPFKYGRFIFAIVKNLKHYISFIFIYNLGLLIFIRPIGHVCNAASRFLYLKKRYKIPDGIRLDLNYYILLSGKHEKQIFDLIKSLNSLNLKTILSIQNWDNLTSKSIILALPWRILVMGTSCVDLGSKTQNLSREILIPASLPRFNPYKSFNNSAPVSKRTTFTVLYLGTSVPHNEINLLNALVSKLENENFGKKIEVIFKPHPYRRPRYFEEQYSNKYLVKKGKVEAFPPIKSEHIQLIENSDLVISAPTSMLIESMMMGKKTLLDLTNDGVHRTTAYTSFNRFIHFSALNSIENLVKCFTVEQMFQYVKFEILNSKGGFVRYNLDNLIENSLPDYTDYILNIINN